MSAEKRSKNKTDETSLGAVMQRARVARGLSQKQVAEHLGYSTSQVVSDWERGIRSPPGPVYKKLIKLYDIPAEVLFEAILEERTRILETKLKKLLKLG